MDSLWSVADIDPAAAEDLSALAWVQDELRRSLEAAHKALRRHLREREDAARADLDDVDPSVLRAARQALHQGAGALELVGLPEAAAVLRAGEAAVLRRTAPGRRVDRPLVETIERASFALTDFLARRLAGKAPSPLALFPAYRAVAEAAELDRIHPADLWPGTWSWRELPPEPGVAPRPIGEDARRRFEHQLLGLLRTDSRGGAARTADLCAELAAGSTGRQAATLWRLAAAFYEAQSHGQLASDTYTKRVGARLLAQLRALERGETAVSERLAQDLLFFCAQAVPAPGGEEPSMPRLQAVREAWNLPSGDGTGYATSRLGRFDPAWIAQARRRVAAAKDSWSAVAGGEIGRAPQLAEQVLLVGDSLRRLYPDGERLADALQEAARRSTTGGEPPAAALAMEVATGLLYLEASLEDGELDHPLLGERVARLADRMLAVAAGAEPQPLEPWMEDLYRAVSDRQTMGSVVQELRASLSEVEQAVDGFHRDPSQRGPLLAVPARLGAMRGVLSVLGMEAADRTLADMRDEVDRLVADPPAAEGRPTPAQAGRFARLAGNLGALGFLIDMLAVQPAMARALFVYDDTSRTLNPRMGRVRREPVAQTPRAVPGPRLIEQAQALAADAGRADVPLDAVSRDLDRLSRTAQIDDRPGLAATVSRARAALADAQQADADDPAALDARGRLAGVLQDFVDSASAPLDAPQTGTADPAPPPHGPSAPSSQPVPMSEDEEMRAIFLEEAGEVIAEIEAAQLQLVYAPHDVSLVTAVRRGFHTLKGSSRMVGLRAFGEAAWACEQVYNTRLAEQRPADDNLLAFTGYAVGHLSDWVAEIAAGRGDERRAEPVIEAAVALREAPPSAFAAPAAAPSPRSAPAAPAAPAAQPSAALPTLFDDRGLPHDGDPPAAADAPAPAFAALGFPADLPSAADLDLSIPAAPVTDEAPSTGAGSPELPVLTDLPPPPADVPELGMDAALPVLVDIEDTTHPPADIHRAPTLTEVVVGTVADDLALPDLTEALQGLSAVPLPALESDVAATLPDGARTDAGTWPAVTADADADAGATDEPDAVDGPLDDAVHVVVSDGFDRPEPVEAIEAGEAVELSVVIGAGEAVPGGEVVAGGEPVEPVEPVESLEPLESADPSPPAEPAEPITPDEPSEPVSTDSADAAAVVGTAANDELLAPPSPEDAAVKWVGPLRVPTPLFNIYLNEADELSRRLSTELAEWAAETHRPVGDTAVALAHSLGGSSATVGYADLSVLARQFERTLARSDALGHGDAATAGLFVETADEIRRLLHQFAAGFLHAPPASLAERLAATEQAIAARLALETRPADLPLVLRDLPPAEPLAPLRPAAEADEPDALGDEDPGDDPASWPRAPITGIAPLDVIPLDEDMDVVDAIDPDLFPVFDEEAGDLLPRLGAHLRDWHRRPADTAHPSAALRALHTFKGGARLAGAMRLGEMAHRLEADIEQLVGGSVTQPDVETLQIRADGLAERLEGLREAWREAHDRVSLDFGLAPPARPSAAVPVQHAPVDAPVPEPVPRAEAEADVVARPPEMDAAPVTSPSPVAPPDDAVAPAPALEGEAEAEAEAEAGPDEAASSAAAEQAVDAVAHAVAHAGPVAEDVAEDLAKDLAEDVAVPEAGAEAEAAHDEPVAPAEAPAPAVPAAPPPIDWTRFLSATAVSPAAADTAAADRALPPPPSAVKVRTPVLERMVGLAGEVNVSRSRIDASVQQMRGSLGDLADNLVRLREQLRDVEVQAETQMASRREAARAAQQAFDPLEFDRFTRLQELTRMMAESVNDVATVHRNLQRSIESAEDGLATQARISRELQDDLLRTRMVEFESLSERLYRVVRQAAKEAGRQVRLDIVGGTIEVDRGVLDRMTPAFEHLLRNAVAHGIEPAQARAAAGKPETGLIVVSLAQEGNDVAVEFRDDGAGLDLDRIRERAVAQGLLAPDAQPGDAALQALIFEPGFSTATEVTGLAGRGIGMDVVRSEVAAMGGRIETASAAGEGTRFRLVLPLTTAVTQVVMLRCGAHRAAVPATLVEIVRRIDAREIDRAAATGAVTVGDRTVPFYWLGALLQWGGRSLEPPGRTRPLVVIRSAQQRVALQVDEVMGTQEVVVKNVGPQLARLPGLGGVSVLPSGEVALIYNPVALASAYGVGAREVMRGAAVEASEVAADGTDGADTATAASPTALAPLVLVVDDSLTVRRVTQRLLVREGYRVALAKDGLEAIERLGEERPAVVLSDIEMPRMDGFDLVRNIRGDPDTHGLPVIMITSRIAQKHRDVAAALGVDHYLGKPYAEDELLGLVARYARVSAGPA